jgi:16S rRNA (cytosine1402-N4)-methyltransferase
MAKRRERPADDDAEGDIAHLPVMLGEVLEHLAVRPGGRYIDATLGAGGHAAGILERSAPDGRLLGIDRDETALAEAGRRLAPFASRVQALRGNFADIGRLSREAGWGDVDGILIDLGFSSMQIDDPARGFAFRTEGRLDMRMDRRQALSAMEVVNKYPESELARIFHEYGEERRSRRLAGVIAEERRKEPIGTTARLAEVVLRAVGRPPGSRIHPATRVFQAIRMEVNDELGNIARSLPDAVSLLRPGGRLAVLSYHSVEDRAVKEVFRRLEGKCLCRPDAPICVCGAKREVHRVTRRPLEPGPAEVDGNRRARSAKLRVVERMGVSS